VLPVHWNNGGKLFAGRDFDDSGGRGTPGRPGRVRFRPFSERVEPQDLELGFAALPDDARLASIDRELSALLERVVSG
jgi:hypothetical protein